MENSGLHITVVIPTFNRAEQLQRCLFALGRQDYPLAQYDIVVVNDGGTGDLRESLRELPEHLTITWLAQPNRGPAAARNLGAAHARGEVLAFTDDDCLPAPGWLRALAGRIEEPEVALVGGATLNRLQHNPYAATSQFIVELVYRHYNREPERARFFASNNLAVRRRDFEEIGGFDVRFRTTEDRELCDRCRLRGKRLVYEPDAVVEHAHDLDFAGFVRQHFNYGRGAYRYHSLRRLRGSGRMLDDADFHSDLSNWLWPRTGPAGLSRVKLISLMLLWQMTNAAGFFWQALQRERLELEYGHPEPGTRSEREGETLCGTRLSR